MTPTPQQIKQARTKAGLTQTQAGQVVYVTLRGWQRWEYGERSMSLGYWELFKLKTGLTLTDNGHIVTND